MSTSVCLYDFFHSTEAQFAITKGNQRNLLVIPIVISPKRSKEEKELDQTALRLMIPYLPDGFQKPKNYLQFFGRYKIQSNLVFDTNPETEKQVFFFALKSKHQNPEFVYMKNGTYFLDQQIFIMRNSYPKNLKIFFKGNKKAIKSFFSKFESDIHFIDDSGFYDGFLELKSPFQVQKYDLKYKRLSQPTFQIFLQPFERDSQLADEDEYSSSPSKKKNKPSRFFF
jgi:hypothetical protein